MATDTQELSAIPSDAGAPPEDRAPAVPAVTDPDGSIEVPVVRLILVVACPVLAAAIMTGGLFIGAGGRVWATIAGSAGIALAWRVTKTRQPVILYSAAAGGVLLIGLLAVLPTGFGNVTGLASQIRTAMATSDVLRPPVDFQPGWHAILAWVMAALGFAAGWLAIEMKRPALGLVATLPVVGLGAISLPKTQQLGSGLAALVLFGLGLGLLSGAQPGDEEERRAARSYEVRRAVRALPLIGLVTLLLYFASRSSFLFPDPIIDPTQDAKIPKSIPLDQVKDRVLFTIRSTKLTGPWKMGSIDVYEDDNWKLAPFSESQLLEVPESGLVNKELDPATRATFEVRGLEGAILPGLAPTVGIVAEGPTLAFDERVGNIRLAQGQIQPGFVYIVAGASVPTEDQVRRASPEVPKKYKEFLKIPDPPPAVEGLLRLAPKNRYDRLVFVRTRLLRTVIAQGAGTPVAVPPSKVQDMLAGTKHGTPYEIVAGQAMLARWAGIPARIGYGYDRGDDAPGGVLEIRPKHGALWLEVYFKGHGWLPIQGDPLQAQSSSDQQQQQTNKDVAISQNVSVQLFLPTVTETPTRFFEQVRTFVYRTVPILLILLLIYYLWPLPYKAFRRARRRTWAAERGPEARVSLAYSEWRDYATDFGYRHYTDTPLMFLERVVPDQEHSELAWLVTRTLWGDLRGEVTEAEALAAEELSRSLRRRLSAVQASTLRFVALLSRLSIRHPYAPGLDVVARSLGHEKKEAVHA